MNRNRKRSSPTLRSAKAANAVCGSVLIIVGPRLIVLARLLIIVALLLIVVTLLAVARIVALILPRLLLIDLCAIEPARIARRGVARAGIGAVGRIDVAVVLRQAAGRCLRREVNGV